MELKINENVLLIGFIEPDSEHSPVVAPQMRLQQQGQDVNIQHFLPRAHSQSIAVTQKIAIYLRIQFPLSWCDSCSKHSCSLLCCLMSLPSGKTLVNNRLPAEGLWGDNPFSASPNTFFHYYWSSCTAVTPQTPLQKLFGVSVATFLKLSYLPPLLSIKSLWGSALQVRES